MGGFEPIKILFITAQPDDRSRLSSEFDDINKKIKNSTIKNELDLVSPIFKTDYDELLTRLKDKHPNVLHYSGHSEETGLCLRNCVTGKTQLIENNELIDIFENRASYLKLILLNSCYSANQAEIISKQGIYVLGLKDEISDDLANALAERFYLGFSSQDFPIKIEKAIFRGCKNFVKTYPDDEKLISLWKNGKEIDYKTLETKEKTDINIENDENENIEYLKKSLLNFNYKNQIETIKTNLEIEKSNIFIFDGNSKNEAKFVFRVIEQIFNKLNDKYGYPKFEVLSISNNLSKNNILDNVIQHVGALRSKTVAVCLKFNKKSKQIINEIITELQTNPPLTRNYPFLLFLLPDSHIKNSSCVSIPHSANIILKKISCGQGDKKFKEHLETIESELKKWITVNKIFVNEQPDCPVDLTNFCKDYFEDIDECSFMSCGEKQFLFTLLKEFIKQHLGFEITFDNQLNLKLKEWQNQ